MNIRTLDFTSGVRRFWLLTILCAALYIPGISVLPPIDRDEARFMQSTKQMIESGDYGRIRFQAEPRDKKPVGAHWVQAAAVNAFSAQDIFQTWPYRLPSALGAWLAVMSTAWAATRLLGPATGFAAGAILATSVLVIAEAHLAKADALLLGASAAVMGGLLQAYSTKKMSAAGTIIFWASLGAGVLIKGPILLGVVALAVITLGAADKSLAWLAQLNPKPGVWIALGIVAIWPLTAGLDEVLRYARAAASQDLWPKVINGVESHGAPPGTHLAATVLTLWPWVWALPVSALSAWQKRTDRSVRFCIAWIVPFWLVLELVPTKLPHYVLPLFPAIAVLIAIALTSKRNWQVTRFVGVGIGGLILLSSIMAALTIVLADKLPSWRELNLSKSLAAAIHRHDSDADNVILIGYHEPSAVFLLGTDATLTNPQNAAALMTSSPNAIAAVDRRDVAELEMYLARSGQKIVSLENISGYNYSRGEPLTLVVVKAIPSPDP